MNPSEPNSDPDPPVAGPPASADPEEPVLLPAGGLPDAPAKAQQPELKPEPPPQPEQRDTPRKEKDRDKDKSEKNKDKDRGDKDKDKHKKKKDKHKGESREIDPWQRYKALLDTLKESQDLVDLADHKARFALMIMGALNAAILFAGTRAELLARVPDGIKPWLYLYFTVYASIAIYFLLQAIESLRPRRHASLPRKASVSDRDESLGLRFFAEAIRYDTPTYLNAWQTVRVSQLNAEIAQQVHVIARINNVKYAAVAKLYLGLQAITVLTAGLLIVLGSIVWIDLRMTALAAADVLTNQANAQAEKSAKPNKDQAEEEGPVKIKAGKPSKGGWLILGEPEQLEATGVREPSGITFSAKSKSLFAVGDEGSLVEFSSAGKSVRAIPVNGNLEDVTEHTPSGRLVLLSEKKSEFLVYDPVTGQRTGKFKMDSLALMGEEPTDKNQGFEGLAFRAEAGHPGGGVFYLVHQRAPALMISFAFDPTAASRTIGAADLIKRTVMPTREDLTAVTYDAALDRLFLVTDSKDRLLMLSASGEEQAEIVLPGAQQEGVAFDPEGNLWIADDRAGLLVFRGARARIQAAIKNPPPDQAKEPAVKKPAGNEN